MPCYSAFLVHQIELTPMDFNQIRYFLALADTLNFTRAAEKCHVSQPALTQGIKRLEEELGGELVHRDGRYNELTKLGKSLRNDFEQINRMRLLVKKSSSEIVSGEVAELNIGIMCTIGPQVLAGMLNIFQMDYPMLSVALHDVTPPAVEDLLLTGGLDAVFCARRGAKHSRLRYVELYEEPMVVAFPPKHDFINYETVPLIDIVKEPYVERLHCEFRQDTHEFSAEQALELNVVFRSEREDWIQSLIRDGVGVGMLPLYSLLKPSLDYRFITEPVLTRKVELAITNNTRLSPALNKLVEFASSYDWPSVETSD